MSQRRIHKEYMQWMPLNLKQFGLWIQGYLTKRKELEKHNYVHLNEDQSDPELRVHKHRHVSRSPATIDHIEKVHNYTIPNVHGCKCGFIFDRDGLFSQYSCSRVCCQLGKIEGWTVGGTEGCGDVYVAFEILGA